MSVAISLYWGSSPHTRGALAGVGVLDCGDQDHPRIRGEHAADARRDDPGDGSSPHTRGARTTGRILLTLIGIIPAYAGSTGFRPGRALPDRDHPRIRGEHDDSDQYVIDGLGSSPHTRGARTRTSGRM